MTTAQQWPDKQLVQKAIEWITQDGYVYFVTVLKTWGSSPRPPGSMMVISAKGDYWGSVSGGCVEEDLISRCVNQELNTDDTLAITQLNYGVDRENAAHFGLPCGGRLQLLVEKLTTLPNLNVLAEAIEKNQLLARHVCLTSGEVSLASKKQDTVLQANDQFVSRVFGAQWTMLIIGANQVAHHLADFAISCQFNVIVCDPRDLFQQSWQHPNLGVNTRMPDDAVNALTNFATSVVVSVSHDPKLDDLALIDALTQNVFYVGAMGSHKTSNARRKRLRQMELTDEQLARLHAPIGLDIGSHQPAEIAISIMAEVIACQNKRQLVL